MHQQDRAVTYADNYSHIQYMIYCFERNRPLKQARGHGLGSNPFWEPSLQMNGTLQRSIKKYPHSAPMVRQDSWPFNSGSACASCSAERNHTPHHKATHPANSQHRVAQSLKHDEARYQAPAKLSTKPAVHLVSAAAPQMLETLYPSRPLGLKLAPFNQLELCII